MPSGWFIEQEAPVPVQTSHATVWERETDEAILLSLMACEWRKPALSRSIPPNPSFDYMLINC